LNITIDSIIAGVVAHTIDGSARMTTLEDAGTAEESQAKKYIIMIKYE
jgi:hypothetical protein